MNINVRILRDEYERFKKELNPLNTYARFVVRYDKEKIMVEVILPKEADTEQDNKIIQVIRKYEV